MQPSKLQSSMVWSDPILHFIFHHGYHLWWDPKNLLQSEYIIINNHYLRFCPSHTIIQWLGFTLSPTAPHTHQSHKFMIKIQESRFHLTRSINSVTLMAYHSTGTLRSTESYQKSDDNKKIKENADKCSETLFNELEK